MGKVARSTIPIGSLGAPDLQAYTPKQEEAIKKIAYTQEDRADIWKKILKTAGKPLTTDRLVATLKENPYWVYDLLDADKKYDNEMRRAIRVGLDTYPYVIALCRQKQSLSHNPNACNVCIRNRTLSELSRLGVIGYPPVREWIVQRGAFRRQEKERPFRTLRDKRPDLDGGGMRRPLISRYYMEYAEEISRLLHEEKRSIEKKDQKRFRWKEIFRLTDPLRADLEFKVRENNEEKKAPKHGSPRALQKFAEDYHLLELIEMEPELKQMQPMVEQLAEQDASVQETLEAFGQARARRHIEEHIDAAGGVNNAT